MEQIILIDSDPEHALTLKASLEDVDCLVEVCSDIRSAPLVATKQKAQVVVLVLQSAAWWKVDLRKFCDAMARLDCTATVLCLLRWPLQGPDDRLYGEEFEVVVFHEGY